MDGQGISDVTVQVLWARRPRGDFPVRHSLGTYSPRRRERHEFARTTTDATGAFAILLPAWFVQMKPKADLLTSKENYGIDKDDPFIFKESSDPKVIVLAKEERIEGSIIDEFGNPVAGARVGMVVNWLELDRTYSDELGRFSIGRRAQEGPGNCFVYASRSPSDMGLWARWPESGIPLRMTLPRGSTKTLHLRDAANRPLRNASVTVTAASTASPSRPFRMTAMQTDDDGIAVVEGITEEPLRILLGGDGAKVDPGPESVVVIKTARQIPLEVVDDTTGIGLSDIVISDPLISGECVFLGSDSWRSGNYVTFQIGRHELSFMTVGYEPWSGVVSIDRDTQELKVRLKKKKM